MPKHIKLFNQYIKESYDAVPVDFEVDDYEISDNSITVLCYFPDETDFESYDEVVLDKDDFTDWAENEVNLDWVEDYHDPSDYYGHGQRTGTLTMEEWWDQADAKEIYGLFKKYIKEKGIEVKAGRDKKDIEMDRITKTQMEHDEDQLRREQGL